MNYKKLLLIGFILICAYFLFKKDETYVPVESVDLLSATALDYNEDSEYKPYKLSYTKYVYLPSGETSSMLISGEGPTIGSSREERQRKTDQKHIVALQKVMLLGEDLAKNGLDTYFNIIFQNLALNDMAQFVVCKGKSVDVLSYKIIGYPSSADYIEGLIKNSVNGNFFSSNYKLIDAYVRVDTEGRNLVLPYLEIKDKDIMISGLAIFDGYKMARVVGMEDARILNLLREDNVKGILTMKKSPHVYVDIYGKTKRKVKVKKNKDGYDFIIDIKIDAALIDNTMYKNIASDPKVKDRFEKDMAGHVKEMSKKFIEKMQKEYGIDCLDLGFNAVSKYGEDKNADWNEIVSNSNVEVNIDVTLSNMGRGDF